MKHFVAVYGSLKRGYGNHHLLDKACYIGSDTLTSLSLYNLGPYPGALAKPSDGVTVEVYAVNDPLLAMLDELEGYDSGAEKTSLYVRRKIQTSHGLAWVYLYNRPVRSGQYITDGNW
ncbi:gamma-glutamylcyclotransferase family protein [Marinobacter orientalis]|uniref:Gamma-glutamylcyclotransferase family protein n=1 Tax=Marinobacter orientalis TaxID=1928859 RepID=A0A7Y0RDK8_9GAMM|nr:gamma-glutamylcyclotransferase family protein [Marinobacter orientalis]NMT64265.1 gamma-glutamylcyclotransferase [Marinobacter orientalis]TGX49484.1 gamma-glutamylcyclotransferase [Marinobacter orientalis]